MSRIISIKMATAFLFLSAVAVSPAFAARVVHNTEETVINADGSSVQYNTQTARQYKGRNFYGTQNQSGSGNVNYANGSSGSGTTTFNERQYQAEQTRYWDTFNADQQNSYFATQAKIIQRETQRQNQEYGSRGGYNNYPGYTE